MLSIIGESPENVFEDEYGFNKRNLSIIIIQLYKERDIFKLHGIYEGLSPKFPLFLIGAMNCKLIRANQGD